MSWVQVGAPAAGLHVTGGMWRCVEVCGVCSGQGVGLEGGKRQRMKQLSKELQGCENMTSLHLFLSNLLIFLFLLYCLTLLSYHFFKINSTFKVVSFLQNSFFFPFNQTSVSFKAHNYLLYSFASNRTISLAMSSRLKRGGSSGIS